MDTNSIHCIDRLDVPCHAAAFLGDLLGLLCSTTLTVSVVSGECTMKAGDVFSPTLSHHY
jgi:hypothetical protein